MILSSLPVKISGSCLAVTFGRFSPMTKAHIKGFLDILNHCDHLVVGIIDSYTTKVVVPVRFECFCAQADKKNDQGYTRFTLEERFAMASAALRRFIDSGRVSVKVVPRPEYAVVQFTEMFPIDTYKVMFSGVADNQFDCERNNIMPDLLGREVFLIKPSYEVVHNSQILDSIRKGNGQWADIIPEDAYDIFLMYARERFL